VEIESYQATSSIDACAAHIGAVHPFRPSKLPKPLFRHLPSSCALDLFLVCDLYIRLYARTAPMGRDALVMF
jgi:hypothetical protein